MNRVVVTGIGVCSPLGNDPDSFFTSLIECRSGIRRFENDWHGVVHAGVIASDLGIHFPKLKRVGLDRVAMLALLAARQAHAASGLNFEGEPGETAGLYWGSGMGGAATLETTYQDLWVRKAARVKPSTVVAAMTNAATGQIGIELGMRGPTCTYSSACSSSAVAVGEAFHAVRFGLARTALAGGSEALLTEGVIKAWESLGTLARIDAAQPETSCRPFAADRSGFLLAEGAAALMLESLESARARGATILAEIIGYGNTGDASHITQPDADGQARAMRAALAEAGLNPDQVDHINAHGTGTKAGDVSETAAIHKVFGPCADSIPVSATKALHGHLMGATGALEFIAAIEALRRRIAPPTAHLWQPDPACDLDYVPLHAKPLARAEVAMSNSFGFGGSNAVLVARRFKD